MKTRPHLNPIYDVRIIDSDTIIGWLQVAPNVRIQERIRIKHVEGGELGTPEGMAGRAHLALIWTLHAMEQACYTGSMSNRDKYGRLVGDIAWGSTPSLAARLLQSPTHWLRDRNGNEHGRPKSLTS